MERYNLPAGGIEVSIEGGSPHKLDTVNAVTAKPATPVTSPSPPKPQTSNKLVSESQQQRPAQAQKFQASQLPPKKHWAPIRYIVSRSLVLVSTLAIVGNIPVHSNVGVEPQARQTQLAALISQSEKRLNDTALSADTLELELPELDETEIFAGHEAETLPAVNEGRWKLYQVNSGDTLESILASLKLNDRLDDLTTDPEVAQVLAGIQPGAKLLTQVTDNQLQQLIYTTGDIKSFFITYHEGQYNGHWEEDLLEARRSQIYFTINKPFHAEARQAGLTPSLSRQLTRIFKKDVNFRRLAIGDQVRVIFEDYIYQGERIATDNVLAAEFDHRGTLYQRVRFTSNDATRYLRPNADLELKKVAFNRYPLKNYRLTSSFGMRRHPIYGSRRMHTGTDFAAPRGTPIYATADGTVRFAGRKGGYGITVVLNHMNSITTHYTHMSRYKKGLNSGDKIKRGDVIGYIGSTGTSTGNHTHYEFRIAGKPHNPMTVELPTTGILSPEEMQQFRQHARNMRQELETFRKTASKEPVTIDIENQYGG